MKGRTFRGTREVPSGWAKLAESMRVPSGDSPKPAEKVTGKPPAKKPAKGTK